MKKLLVWGVMQMIKEAHFNMIEQQVRTWDVLDPMVLDLLARVAREDFVPEEYIGLAYADLSIPLGHGEVMMHPVVEARMLQALDMQATDNVLEVGTGSGYITALLASVTSQVTSVEIHDDLRQEAGQRLTAKGIGNVTLETGDASQGWRADERYDVIVLTGSTPILPESFRTSLDLGGRLFAIVGESPLMEARLITRTGDDEWDQRVLFETDVPSLINAPKPGGFEF